MSGGNSRNLYYFEASSMRGLYTAIDSWQAANGKRLLSVDVERDGDVFCGIVLSNPMEVIIMDGYGEGGVDVRDNALKVWSD
jgi:hypothetical protein